MLITTSALISIFLLIVVMAPFFIGKGGMLQESSSINSTERLDALKLAFLSRYLQDEASFKEGELSQRAWDKRREYLTHRYVDVARRHDYLSRTHKEAQI